MSQQFFQMVLHVIMWTVCLQKQDSLLKSHKPELTVFSINRIPSHLFFSFGDKVSHLSINKDVCATPLVFQSQATVQCQLHSIDPDIFPLLETSDIPVSTNKIKFDKFILIFHFEKMIFCNTLWSNYIKLKRGVASNFKTPRRSHTSFF